MEVPRGSVLGLAVGGSKTILPDSEGVFDAIARIGYEFEHAMADLVDNSIDANASMVTIRFIRDAEAVRGVAVVDDGAGMDDRQIDLAMSFGARSGKQTHQLGKYGMGLKSATFSQCRVLTVISKRDGRVAARRWTAEKARQDWTCDVLEPVAAGRYFDEHTRKGKSGTLVEWSELDKFTHSMERPDEVIDERSRQLSNHLGLIFHRYLEASVPSIRIGATDLRTGLHGFATPIQPLNPFPKVSGLPQYPKLFATEYRGSELKLTAHVWNRNATDAGFKLGAGRLAKKQGIYIYRNDRMIQAGGWNGLRNDAEVHSSLARVEFDLPADLDDVFKPTVQKSAVVIPEELLAKIRNATSGKKKFSEYLSDAETAYREQKPANQVRHGLVPRSGFTRPLIAEFEDRLGSPETPDDEVDFEWRNLDDDEFFRMEPNRIVLNATFRTTILYGNRGSKGDAPIVKTLLMFLLRDELTRARRSKNYDERLQIYNNLLVAAARAQA